MTPSSGWVSIPNSFVSLFIFYILSYLLLKIMGCISGCLVSSASVQKLFCGICSVFKWSFDEFVGEKVVSLSYSSAILGPPPSSPFLFNLYAKDIMWNARLVEAQAVCCHPAYLTYMQSTSCEMLGQIKHKLESRLPGEISITSDTQMTPPLWQKVKRN